MNKLIFQDGQDELLKAAGSLSVLFETDRHVKSAASSAISAKLMSDNKPDDDHFGIHLIAMGSQEKYGFNRNGDGWPEKGLRARHKTFVTNGHLFEEHRNSHPKLKIGDVKASAYNDDMDRVELIVHANKKKAAAAYETAKAGKPLSFSMSAKVPHDVCSVCDNKAKGSKNYCVHLKQSMCQYLPKFKKFAFAINDHPTFFDISQVKNPADRIAHHIEYAVDMEKAASTAFPFSDILAEAEGIMIAENAKGCTDLVKQAALARLAETEQFIDAAIKGENVGPTEKLAFFNEAVRRAFEPNNITEAEMAVLRGCEPDRLFAGLAKRATCLPFEAFCSYVTGETMEQIAANQNVKTAKTLLPTVFRDLIESPVEPTLEDMFEPDFSKLACGDVIDRTLDSVADRHSVLPARASARIIQITATRGTDYSPAVKAASVASDASVEARKLAKVYGLYKVAFCVAAEQVVSESFVDEPVRLIVSYQHLI